MPAPKIKICGINTPESLDAAVKARADLVGFNFYPPSPRKVSVREVAELSARAADRIGQVAVFVDPGDTELAGVVSVARLDAIQLHGEETPERCAQVQARFGLPVWKALPVAGPSDLARVDSYRGAADLILFDAKTPKGALPGGMGLSFDWSLLSGIRTGTEWGLAGGLTSTNVAEAVRQTSAPLVDTSSGVESAPGVKDVDLIAAFCQAARNSRNA